MTAINGIDVSVWQGEIDWARVKAGGVGFAMVRAGYGLAADPNFARNMEGAAAQGIPVGAYLYSRAVTTGRGRRGSRLSVGAGKALPDRLPRLA